MEKSLKKMALFPFLIIIRTYQLLISPWLGHACRYQPTCSEYAVSAVNEHGFFKGGWLTLKRLGKCHPWGGTGYDPVPPSASSQTTDNNCCHWSPKQKDAQ